MVDRQFLKSIWQCTSDVIADFFEVAVWITKLTIAVFDIQKWLLCCSGKGGPDKLEYELMMDFYADIDPSVRTCINLW